MKNGDIVQLKSGGPLMTVKAMEQQYRGIYCTWFDAKGKIQNDFFAEETLLEKPDAVCGKDGK